MKQSFNGKVATKEEDLTQARQTIIKIQKEEGTKKDIYCAELPELRQENQILSYKLSNVEVKLISKQEELTNALMNNLNMNKP